MVFLLLLGLLFAYLLYRFSSSSSFNIDYARIGVHTLKPPYPLLGSYPKMLTMTIPLLECGRILYGAMRGKAYGVYYIFNSPVMVVNEPEMIRRVLVKDFDHFTDRVTMESANKVRFTFLFVSWLSLNGFFNFHCMI